MIEEKELLKKIQQLPDNLKEQLLRYADFLQKENEPSEKRIRKAGSSPGKYTLAPDFDEPLPEFEAYT